MTKTMKRLMDIYVDQVRRLKRHPSGSELSAAGATEGKINYNFHTIGKLRAAAKEYKPDAFRNLVDDDVFNSADMTELEAAVKKHKRFFITTAVTGCRVKKTALQSVESWSRKTNGCLLILPVTDPASVAGWSLDPVLENSMKVFGDLKLNSNISIKSIKLSAKQIDPATGLARIGNRNGSFIYGSPKQRLKMVATSAMKLPHAIMTTGAITNPNYETTRYMSERTAVMAKEDHVMGGLIVEVADDQMYHFRQVQFDKDGSFIDLGTQFCADGTYKKVKAVSLTPGDWHSGETDPNAANAWKEVMTLINVDDLVLHDSFNGMSINHHEWNHNVTRAMLAKEDKLNLEKEGKEFIADLQSLSNYAKRVVIVKSNHDEFLDRYLQEGRYIKDAQNFYLSHKLVVAMCEGHDPLRYFAEMLGLPKSDKFKWLSRDEDFKIAGIEHGAHGDKGANGAKGSLIAMENAYGKSNTGHAHTSEILRDQFRAGTSTHLRLSYNKGASSWVHSGILTYPNGSRQLVHVIKGKWKL
jgi:hypothetical protein